MDGSTKILTVSYGTFSCTLEGFDDPLGAMRDIAEYFRDLSADDRYFGAEPLTPDVEMLQNIAKRDVSRRVEARQSGSGVALRQVEQSDPDTKDPDATPAKSDAQSTDAPDKDAREASAMAARVVTAAKVVDGAVKATKPGTPEAGTGPLTFDDDFLMSDEPEDVLAVDPDATPADASPAESVAEKLRRIRSVVSKNIENKPDASFEDIEDVEDAEVIDADKRDRAFTETIEQIKADLGEDDVPNASETSTSKADDADQVKDATQSDIDDFDLDLKDDSAVRDTSKADASDKDAARHDGDDLDDDLPDLTAESDEDEDFDAETSESLFLSSDDAVDPDKDDEVIAAIVESTTEEPNLKAIADKIAASDDDAPAVEVAKPEPAKTDAAIKRTISDIIGNIGERVPQDDTVEAQDHEVDGKEPARALSRPLSEAQESDIGRLLEKTDNKLNEDEVVRRRRVISQMRAAVAATKADRLVSRQVSREVVEEEEQSPYREDLSEVVRPTTRDGAGIVRPTSTTPPLVLVSSQRVNHDVDDVESFVKTDGEPLNFAGFAEDMGAKELPELLEAAAAFTVFTEGQSSFTRPEIMKRVAAVDPTIRMSREESLRSFGQLLRQGKFRKLERGQFTIAKETRFHPKHRIAGE